MKTSPRRTLTHQTSLAMRTRMMLVRTPTQAWGAPMSAWTLTSATPLSLGVGQVLTDWAHTDFKSKFQDLDGPKDGDVWAFYEDS